MAGQAAGNNSSSATFEATLKQQRAWIANLIQSRKS